MVKYQKLSPSDFDIESVGPNFDLKTLIPPGYESSAKEDIPQQKIKAQLRATTAQLNSLVEKQIVS